MTVAEKLSEASRSTTYQPKARRALSAPQNHAAMPFLSSQRLPTEVKRPLSKESKRETLEDFAERIPIDVVRRSFDFPLLEAAERMRISVTSLKRLCRKHGVKRWPHRQIRGLNRIICNLEARKKKAEGDAANAITEELRDLYQRRHMIIELVFESERDSSHPSSTPTSGNAPMDHGTSRFWCNGNDSSIVSDTMGSKFALTPPTAAPVFLGSTVRHQFGCSAGGQTADRNCESNENSLPDISVFSSPTRTNSRHQGQRFSVLFRDIAASDQPGRGIHLKAGQQHLIPKSLTQECNFMTTEGGAHISSTEAQDQKPRRMILPAVSPTSSISSSSSVRAKPSIPNVVEKAPETRYSDNLLLATANTACSTFHAHRIPQVRRQNKPMADPLEQLEMILLGPDDCDASMTTARFKGTSADNCAGVGMYSGASMYKSPSGIPPDNSDVDIPLEFVPHQGYWVGAMGKNEVIGVDQGNTRLFPMWAGLEISGDN